ncbi:MAG: helix-turn-helix domain-containing protein, partial [Chloroflexi bacterium]|nr:helix-turn-helix domain-containing protein [Chloroflexota bacterium]
MRKNLAATIHDFPLGLKGRVSVTTLYRWEKAYRQGGFDELKPQPRRDKPSRVISSETLDRAEALKREQPFRSARAIINILEMDRENPIPEKRLAERTLRRQLAKRNATTAQLTTEQQPKAYRRFERNAFGDLWQGDALHGPYLPDPANPDKKRQTFLFAFIDDHTRLVPHAQFYWNEQLPRLEDSVPLFLGIASSVLSAATVRPWRFMLTEGQSTSRNSSIRLAPRWGFSVFWPRPTTPKGRAKHLHLRSGASVERFFG